MKFELVQTLKMGLEFDQSEYLVEVFESTFEPDAKQNYTTMW